jgi:hypothetical protein
MGAREEPGVVVNIQNLDSNKQTTITLAIARLMLFLAAFL